MMLPPLIDALLADAACYDHPVKKLELIETHISWVVLTGDYAYKIRKPVNLGFLDFSTLPLRRQDCLEELRLNRRLAADYYLDVVAISDAAMPRINGSGEAIEYAVKMRQFPTDATLDKLAECGGLGRQPIDALAARLAHFHSLECERATDSSPWGEPEEIARPVAENFKVLADRLDDPVEIQCLSALQNWCVAEHARLIPLMTERKKMGWVRECHGDLHLANLAWVDGRLVIFDCLEFSSALRWMDVISEVAFCYMDLLHRKLPALAARFLNGWLEAVGDYQGVALLRYYAVYRALVRAKVAGLRIDQGCRASRTEMNDCLHLAEQLSTSNSPLTTSHSLLPNHLSLTITHGYSGSGKTTYSQRWLERYGMIRLRSDVERKRQAGLSALDKSGPGLYSRQSSLATYRHLAQLAEGLLAAGWPVIVDAAFLERDQRDLFCDLAARCAVPFQILDCQADPAILRERITRRAEAGRDASEADLRVLQYQMDTAQPLGEDEAVLNSSPPA